MKYYRKGRLETAHDQSRNAAIMTLGAWVLFGLAIGIIPSPLVIAIAILVAIFTACISLYLVGLYIHVNPVLTIEERRRFLGLIGVLVLFLFLFRYLGTTLFLALPSVINLIAVAGFKTLQRA